MATTYFCKYIKLKVRKEAKEYNDMGVTENQLKEPKATCINLDKI